MKFVVTILATFLSVSAFAGNEIKQGEIKQGEIKQGEIKQGEIKQGEIKQGEIKQGEIKQGEIKQGEVKQGEVKQGEVTQGEVKQGNIVQGQQGEIQQSPYQYRRVMLTSTQDDQSLAAQLYNSMSAYGRYLESLNPSMRPNVYLEGSRVYLVDDFSGRMMCDRNLVSSQYAYSCDLTFPYETGWTSNRSSLPALLSMALRYHHDHGGYTIRSGSFDGYPSWAAYDPNPNLGIVCYSARIGGSLSLLSYHCAFNGM